ncbi:phospholipid carrier-dependent glycosyltransferase [Cohnella sp. GCM10027633]|uniref:phospholipid carrier-dependent glycosyltransferase n=1 Tax=unclassified Cohnella TaxID=2636738 RepID=UPI00362790A9
MRRKLVGVLALALLASVCVFGRETFAAESGRPMEVNGAFAADAAGQPEGWRQDGYLSAGEASVLEIIGSGGADGGAFAKVMNREPNDARWIRSVAVKPDTFYRLSAYVRAEVAPGAEKGANLSVLGIIDTSADFLHTDGQWVPIEYVGKSGAEQTELTIALRLGGYGALAAGSAEFSGFAMEELGEAPPDGAAWSAFDANEQPSQVSAGGEQRAAGEVPAEYAAIAYALAFAGLLLGAAYVARPSRSLPARLSTDEGTIARSLGVIFVVGALLRIGLSMTIKGHPIDMLDFGAWADRAYGGGLNGFFAEGMFADYPPGYIYVLYALGALRTAFGLTGDSPAAWLLLKLPAIAADVALSVMLARLAAKRFGASAALPLALFIACNPMLIVNSSLWGQVDSVLALLLVLFVLSLMGGRTAAATLWLTIGCLVKPQAVVLAPLLAFVLWREKSAKRWAISAACAIGALIVLVLPFEALREPAGLWEHYRAMFASYPYASLNAANVYGLLGLNGTTNGHWIGPMTVNAWSNALTIAIVAYAAVIDRRFRSNGRSDIGIPVVALLIAVLIFTLRSGMHERYGFIAAVLALLACVFVESVKLRAIAAAFSLVQFANIAYVLDFGLRESYYVPSDDGFFRLLSLLEVALAGWAAYESWRLSGPPVAADAAKGQSAHAAGKRKPIARKGVKPPLPAKENAARQAGDSLPASDRKLTRKDALFMVVLTLVGGAIGLYRLGSADAPHTAWKPAAGQYAEFSLPGTEYVADVLVYAGLGNGSLELERTTDGATWMPALTIQASDGTVFQWQRVPAGFEASAVRLRAPATGAAAMFYELSLRDSRNEPILLAASGDATLIDEPNSVPGRPSYKNGMYFDEIYHARTAYETAHGIEPYETTHPPLGKVIMSAGISLFGMNPFGWRFMGAIFGALMIPLLYVFGKRMFGRTDLAALAGGLIALDFMRFSLSRIGTVDVFAVFFIALSAYAVYEYYRQSVIEQASMRRTLVPLAVSALAIGMAIATKWIGLYAGLGIAVALLLVWRSSRFPRGRYAATLAWTAGLFALVPLAVYFASYIPFLRLPGPGHGIADVVAYQKHMFNYHSDLVATHPFSSSWWEWPLIQRPVWTYAGQAANAGDVVSIVLMGNPAVWWIGSAAAVYMALRLLKDRSLEVSFLLIGLAAQLVPWMFVSRLTFIYHFYASVPFIVLCSVYALRSIAERVPSFRLRYGIGAYAAIAACLFAMFYPILAGAEVDRDYVVQALKWYKSWIISL